MIKARICKSEVLGYWPILITILIAMALRLHQLSADSLWGDEIGTLIRSSPQKSLVSIILDSLSVPGFPNTPLYFIIGHLFLRIGENDFILRFPAFLFGTAGIAALFVVGRWLWDDRVGLVAAVLLAFSSFHIRYSQEARYPSLILLISLLSLLFLLQAMHKPGWRAWAGFTATAILNIYAFLPMILILGVEVLYFLARRWTNRLQIPNGPREQTSLYFIASILVIMLFTLPLLPPALNALGSEKGLLSTPRLGRFLLRSDYYLEILSLWGAGKGFPLLLFALASIAGIAASVIKKEREALLLAILWITLPVALALGLPLQKAFRLRYLIFVLPFYFLLVARGTVAVGNWLSSRLKTPSRLRRGAMLALPGLLGLLSLTALPTYYQEGKQAWREATLYLQANIQGGEMAVTDRERTPYALRHYGFTGEILLYSPSRPSPPSPGIWVISLLRDCPEEKSRISWLAGYRLKETASFHVAREGVTPLSEMLIGEVRYYPIHLCHFQRHPA